MKKKSTQKVYQCIDKGKKVVVPSENRIIFLKQLARSYHVDKTLPNPLNGFCIN